MELPIHPHPSPASWVIPIKVHTPIARAPNVVTSTATSDAPGPAQTHPKNKTPGAAGAFTPTARAHTMMPGTVPTRCAMASPAQEADHQRIVVGPADQRRQHQWATGAEKDRLGGVTAERAGERRGGRNHQGEAGHFEESQQHDVGQNLVARRRGQHTVDR